MAEPDPPSGATSSNESTDGRDAPPAPDTERGGALARMRTLVEEHRDGLLKVARRFCRDAGEADELVHRTILHVLEHPESLRHEANPRGWLVTIMARLHHGAARTSERRYEHVPIDAVQVAAPEEEDEPDWKAMSPEVLRAAIEELPLKHRTPLTMFVFDGMKQQDIAKALGTSHEAVRAQVHRARRELGRILTRSRSKR